MRSIAALILVLLAMLSGNAPARAASYFVDDVTTADAPHDLTVAVKSLVQSGVTEAGESLAPETGQADYVLKSALVRLGSAYVLTVNKMRGERSIYVAHEKAASAEELDDAANRAVRAAILSKPAKTDTRVGEVKQSEEQIMRRRILARNATYFGLGPASFVNMGVTSLAYNVTLGHLWDVTPHAAVKIFADGIGSADLRTYILSGQIGVNFYLWDTESSPYLGLGFGFGASGSGSSSATTIGAFAGSAGLGYQFFRTSSTQLDLFAGYTDLFGNNTIGAPGVYGLRVGLLF